MFGRCKINEWFWGGGILVLVGFGFFSPIRHQKINNIEELEMHREKCY